jgi:hypothetical protein
MNMEKEVVCALCKGWFHFNCAHSSLPVTLFLKLWSPRQCKTKTLFNLWRQRLDGVDISSEYLQYIG